MRLILTNLMVLVLCTFVSLTFNIDSHNKPTIKKSGIGSFNLFVENFDCINIPLTRAGKLLLIEARIDNEIGNLVFDTGASGMVLNSTYFRDYVKSETKISSGINGDIGSIQSITVDSINLGDISFRNVKADIIELGHIENSRGIKVLGLFGFSHLRNYEVIIDVKNNQLTLIKVDKKGNRITSCITPYNPDRVEPILESNNVVFFNGLIGGRIVKFCLDTGAEINSISNSLPKVALSTVSITRRINLMGAGSTKKEVLYGVMNDFTFAGKQIEGMETIITNLSTLENVYNMKFSGVVGFDFLNKGAIIINIRKKQMGICYNNTK